MDNNYVNTMEIKEKEVFCTRCGASFKESSRYCMKCGNLNMNHPENQSMKQYIKKENFFNSSTVPKTYKICFLINLLFYIVSVIFMGIIAFISKVDNFSLLIISLCLINGFVFLYFYSLGCIYIKDDKPWWSIFVPFYSFYVFFEVTLNNGWFFLLQFVPIVGQVLLLIALFKLGKKFSKSGLLTLFFPFIMIPLIGLSKDSQISLLNKRKDNELDKRGITKSEKDYKRNKVAKILFILSAILILGYFLWPMIEKFIELIKESLLFFK